MSQATGTQAMAGPLPTTAGGLGAYSAPQRVQGRALAGAQGAEPPGAPEILPFIRFWNGLGSCKFSLCKALYKHKIYILYLIVPPRISNPLAENGTQWKNIESCNKHNFWLHIARANKTMNESQGLRSVFKVGALNKDKRKC